MNTNQSDAGQYQCQLLSSERDNVRGDESAEIQLTSGKSIPLILLCTYTISIMQLPVIK